MSSNYGAAQLLKKEWNLKAAQLFGKKGGFKVATLHQPPSQD